MGALGDFKPLNVWTSMHEASKNVNVLTLGPLSWKAQKGCLSIKFRWRWKLSSLPFKLPSVVGVPPQLKLIYDFWLHIEALIFRALD